MNNFNLINAHCIPNNNIYEPYIISLQISDSIIALSYFLISASLYYYGNKENIFKTVWNKIFTLFISFIFFCGLTHLFQIFRSFITLFWILGISKYFTALVSFLTVIVMKQEIPNLINIPKTINKLENHILTMNSYIFHEIRVPLNSFKIALQNISISHDTHHNQNYINIMNTNIDQISHILNDMLSVHQIINGKFNINPLPVNIIDIIKTSTQLFTTNSTYKNIHFHIDISPDIINKSIIVDRIRINQCLNNMLSNAFKFTDKNVIFKAYSPSPDTLIFSVKDDGIGISENDQKKLFQPYNQIKNNKNEIGTGLGLVIIKQIIELHSGNITVNSELNKGSEFIASIKCKLNNLLTENNNKHSLTFKNKLQILIIDDNIDNCTLLDDHLKLKGLHSHAISDPRNAINYINSNPHLDLIITDNDMPYISGIELIKIIRKSGINTPILGLSGLNTPNEFINAGAQYFIEKPINLHKLYHILLNIDHNKNNHIAIDINDTSSEDNFNSF